MKAEEILLLSKKISFNKVRELVDELLDSTDTSCLKNLEEDDIQSENYEITYKGKEPIIVDEDRFYGDELSKFLFYSTSNNMRIDVIAAAAGARFVYRKFEEDNEIRYYFK